MVRLNEHDVAGLADEDELAIGGRRPRARRGELDVLGAAAGAQARPVTPRAPHDPVAAGRRLRRARGERVEVASGGVLGGGGTSSHARLDLGHDGGRAEDRSPRRAQGLLAGGRRAGWSSWHPRWPRSVAHVPRRPRSRARRAGARRTPSRPSRRTARPRSHAVPAMSRCAHGVSPAKRCRNSAPVIAPGRRPAGALLRSAKVPLTSSAYSAVQRQPPGELAGALRRPRRPARTTRRRCRAGRRRSCPSATMTAPVRVARSTSRSAPSAIAWAMQSASTSRPSASVLLTSTRDAGERADDVARLDRARRSGRFSVAPTTPITRTGSAEPRDRADRLDHGRAARHVVLHLLHVLARLERDAAAVEGHRLADEAEHRTARAGALVAHRDQRGVLRRTPARPRRTRPCRGPRSRRGARP